MSKDFKKLHPFKWFILENYPFLEDSIDVLTNYQLFCKLGEMYNKQVEVINALGVQVEDITEYFDNLDLQEEVNNKLDEMAESGDLEEIIATYLNTRAILSFDTVSQMKQAENLMNGGIVRTLGFHELNDNGGATYKIKTKTVEDVIDEMTVLSLDDETLVAVLTYDKLNVKQLGAYADDEHDDSSFFNKGISILSENKTTTDYSSDNTLYIPGGEYKISNTINLSVFAKLKTTGYVTINSYCDDITFELSPDGVTYEPGESFERYNYLFGKLIDGEQGFRIINKLEEGNTIALSIGKANTDSTTLNYNVSKTSFDYITINNFHTAIKLNPYNLYLDTFNNIYCEQNDYSIVVGDSTINNYTDSGENISFNNCIFAGSDVVVQYNTPIQSIDFNFNECSFDFNKCIFYSPNNNESSSPARKISIDNSHFESTSYLVDSNSTPHGILFGLFRGYQITISNSRILQTNKYHLFYAASATSYVLNLISNIITVYGDNDAKDPYYQYFANDNVLNIHLFYNECSTRTGIGLRLPSYNTCSIRPDWRKVAAGTTYTLTKNTTAGTSMIDWKNAYFNKLNNTVTVVDNDFGGKSLRFTVDTTNPWDGSGSGGAVSLQMLSKKFNANSGDVFGFSMLYKNLKITGNISFYLIAYDADGNEISTQETTTPQMVNANYVVTTLPRFLQCPVGTQQVAVRTLFAQNSNAGQVQGETFEIGNISVIKM